MSPAPDRSLNRVLRRVSRYSGSLLFVALAAYIVTGFAIVKNFFDPVLVRRIHNHWLYFPTLLLAAVHSFACFRIPLQKKIENRMWADVALAVAAVVFIAIGAWLYLL